MIIYHIAGEISLPSDTAAAATALSIARKRNWNIIYSTNFGTLCFGVVLLSEVMVSLMQLNFVCIL